MRQNKMGKGFFLNWAKGACLVFLLSLVPGCKEDQLYDPNAGKEPLPDQSKYFGFETRTAVNLYVDYGAPGFQALLEVYGEEPVEYVDGTPVKKEGLEALYKAYTGGNGKYEGTMILPGAVSKVYLYTAAWGLPRCLSAAVENGAVRFDLASAATRVSRTSKSTRAYPFNGDIPYTIDKNANLYSLCRWGQGGDLAYDYNSGGDGFINKGYLSTVTQVGQESIGDFVSRLQSFFTPKGVPGVDNSRLVTESGSTNITVKQDGTVLDVVFVNRDAAYNNTFGYYYYKTAEGADPAKVNKYIIFPNVMITPPDLDWTGMRVLKCGDKVRLKYFDGQGKASDTFPAGYTVGWFLYADGYNYSPFGSDDQIKLDAPLFLSSVESKDKQRFITVDDKKSGKVIIGVEDSGNNSYCDLLFYVEATPEGSIDDPSRPDIPDGGEEDKPDGESVSTVSGTLAFEDVWPGGGDYDLNDVVIEYKREIYFNTSNLVTKIVDSFVPVHDGATYKSAFAYQVPQGEMGNIILPPGAQLEPETSSIIVLGNVKEQPGNPCSIVREFGSGNSLPKDNFQRLYNPYIIVEYAPGQGNRTEVHLPKHQATSLADQRKTGSQDDAYYVDRTGAYPFAIDIPVTGFAPATETRPIDEEYPGFRRWADTFGVSDLDWYLHYKK